MSRQRNIDDVIVTLAHPHGDIEIPLVEWIRTGPGPRHLLQPTGARSRATGAPLPLSVIPLTYRNNAISRALIKLRLVQRPWR